MIHLVVNDKNCLKVEVWPSAELGVEVQIWQFFDKR